MVTKFFQSSNFSDFLGIMSEINHYVFFQKKTYYLDSQVKGQSSLPTILIFHDSGLSSNTWLKLGLLHELNVNGYRAVVIDLPGHGGSDKTEIIQDQDQKG